MIKFRCPSCGQKIAVNDEGAGAVIACTCCAENIIVPPETDVEFQFSKPTVLGASTRTIETEVLGPAPKYDQPSRRQARATEQRAEQAMALVHAGLLPHLARWMSGRLVQGLLTQRAQLLASQQSAADRLAELEHRLTRLQKNLWYRLGVYEKRIVELEQQVVAKENQPRVPEDTDTKSRARTDLPDPGLLLRV